MDIMVTLLIVMDIMVSLWMFSNQFIGSKLTNEYGDITEI
jgi:hypothetical protein